MYRLMLTGMLLLGACAQPSAGIDWFEYTELESTIGRLRADRAPADIPVDAEMLARNFRTIAFEREEDPFGTGEPQPNGTDSKIIRKWIEPVLLSIAATERDEAYLAPRLSAFTARLSRVTGHPVRLQNAATEEPVRLLVIYGSDRTMRAMSDADTIARPDWDDDEREVAAWLAETIGAWRFAPSPCAGSVLIGDQPGYEGQIVFAVVLIRKEIPDLLLDACIEEELSQVMGTINDDDGVRPSIFNDDQEFALLTDHDAALLKMLYDPRIRPGMDPETAMPIVRLIARELTSGT